MLYDDNPTILRGKLAVLSASATIHAIRHRVGQQHDLSTDLDLILSRHNALYRRPVVVLLYKQRVAVAAVIFAERCVFNRGIGLLRAGDQVGDGAVIAAPTERKNAMLASMNALLRERRCHTVAATLNGVADMAECMAFENGLTEEHASRIVHRYLPLSATLDKTLRARFTAKKRKNLLYYYRRLSKNYAVEFVPALDVAGRAAESAMLQLAQHSWPSRTQDEIAHHIAFLRCHPECFCMGLRLKECTWLSLVTGWRRGGVTHMPWQMNHEGYKNDSLMQVLRTYLMEHECAAGQTALSWVGGTVSFQTACEPELCLDVLAARPGVRHTFLRTMLAPMLFKRRPEAFTEGSLMLLLEPRHRRAFEKRLEQDS